MITSLNICQFLSRRADMNPNKLSLKDYQSGCCFSYQQHYLRSRQVAVALASLDLNKGDRIGLLLRNGHQFTELFFGAAMLGLVIVPLNWRLVADELLFIVKDAGVTLLAYDADFADTVAEIYDSGNGGIMIKHWLEVCGIERKRFFAQDYEQWLSIGGEVEPQVSGGGDDNLFIMYTSGTTGQPKGAVHTHNTVFWSVINYSVSAGMRYEDIHLVSLPLFHVAALISTLTAFYNGNTLVVLRHFDPKKNWTILVEERISTTYAVPAILNFMRQLPEFKRSDWSSLRWITSGGAPLSVEIIEAYREVGINVTQAFGMTEVCGALCMLSGDDGIRKAGSVGKPFFHTELRIMDAAGDELPPGREGEVIARCPSIMKGYWNRREDTDQAINGGWYLTGDVGVMDEEGFLYIKDRIKDVIISGGENVYPAEVEQVLLQHPAILDAAIIGQISEKWGESPFAVLVRESPTLKESEVLDHCATRLARFKQPKGVVFVDELPRNTTDKLLRRLLRQQFARPAQE